jgi:hypothetical protein
MRTFLVIFAVQVCGFALAAEREPAPDFSRICPPVSGLLNCINLHTNAPLNFSETNLLVVTEFYRMDRIGGDMLRYVVTEDGAAISGIDQGTGVLADVRRKRLSSATLEELRSQVANLPRTNQYPWLSSLVIVSYRKDTNWFTHSYWRHRSADDAPELPALRRLLNLVGERPEANEVHQF